MHHSSHIVLYLQPQIPQKIHSIRLTHAGGKIQSMKTGHKSVKTSFLLSNVFDVDHFLFTHKDKFASISKSFNDVPALIIHYCSKHMFGMHLLCFNTSASTFGKRRKMKVIKK